MASYSTVSLVKEDPAHIRRFAEYYCAGGAQTVFLFYDGTIDPAFLDDMPRVRLVQCDAEFWQGLTGARPDGLEERQMAVYRHVVEAAGADWLLIVDLDEFVFGDMTINAFLDGMPAGVESVAVVTAEAVYGPGDDRARDFGATVFRTPLRSRTRARILAFFVYGRAARVFERGLLGHSAGKQFLRTGRSYSRVGIHGSQRDGKTVTVRADAVPGNAARMYVGHFDALGYDRWVEKWRRRLEGETLARDMGPRRRVQMTMIRSARRAGDRALKRLFERLYGLSAVQFAVLSALGLAFRNPLFAEQGPGVGNTLNMNNDNRRVT
ncbi:glycosyltransferase family 2 protein [Actibacterium sp. D379-3]